MEETNEQKTEEKAEGEEKSGADEDSNDGQHAGIEIIERAEKANAEMKKNLEQKQKLLDREERILARQETLKGLGGGSPAGQIPAKPKEETPAEYKERILKGN